MPGSDALDLVMQNTGWDEASAFSWLQDACDEGDVEVRRPGMLILRARNGDYHKEEERTEFISARVPPERLRSYLNGWEFRRGNVTTALLAAMDDGAEAARVTAASEAPTGAPAEHLPPDAPAPADAAQEAESADRTAPSYKTGAQGRPTSINLIASELKRRRATGQVLVTQAAEAGALAAWLAQAHPDAPKAGPKAIQNSLRAKLSEAVNEAKTRNERPK